VLRVIKNTRPCRVKKGDEFAFTAFSLPVPSHGWVTIPYSPLRTQTPPSRSMLKRGFQFAPGYRLQEFLGRGQFGQVWRATAPGGTAAAVKFIDLSDGQGQKEYDGVRRVKQIRHANLMPITAIWLLDGQGSVIEEAPHDANQTLDMSVAPSEADPAVARGAVAIEPSWLVVSMLLGGRSLQSRLRQCIDEGLPGIPPKELISYMDESAKGIDFLNAPQHDLGEGPISIQHCDVKPANIVLIGSSAVVCDFGLARILTRNQVTATSAAGTPAYMAPEAISGKPSRTSDQYSLAVTYYHLRTGNLPVSDGSLWEVLDAHRQGNLKLGLVSDAEQQVLRKATDLKWEQRFETNVEMVEALREALRSGGHTKPSFIPSSGVAGSAETSGSAETAGSDETAGSAETRNDALATVGGADDPTATIDTAAFTPATARGNSAAPTGEATQPFSQAEHPIGENFLDVADQDADAKPSTRQTSLLEIIRSQPKVAAGVGTTLILLLFLALGTVFSGGGEENSGQQDEQNGAGNSGTDLAQGEQDDATASDILEPSRQAMELLSQAIEIYDGDESEAAALFAQAVALDSQPLFIETGELVGHKGGVMLGEFVPDGKLVTVADEALLWRPGDSGPTPLPGHTDAITAISLSPGGDRLVTSGYDTTPLVWNLSIDDVSQSALPLKGHADGVLATAWHPTEPIVVTTSNDPSIGIWKLGRATESSPQGIVAQNNRIQTESLMRRGAIAIDPKGRWVATISDPIGGLRSALAYPWSDMLATLTDPGSPRPVSVTTAVKARIMQFAGDHEGNATLVVGDDDGAVSLYALSSPPQLISRAIAHSTFVEAMDVVSTENSDIVVTGSSDGTVHWWRTGATDEKRSQTLSAEPISSVDVSSDGRWVAAGCHDGSVWLWDSSGSSESAVRMDAGSMVHFVRIDPQGRWLIAGCDDGIVRRWDLRWVKLLAVVSPTAIGTEIDGPIKIIDSQPLA
jgi:serine/threonine protein kinase/WD40 repeat protein